MSLDWSITLKKKDCEIVGCYHTHQNFTGLCKEHEIDLEYWEAHMDEIGQSNTSIRTYIYEKNKELLG